MERREERGKFMLEGKREGRKGFPNKM
jgi:hypothetical protein